MGLSSSYYINICREFNITIEHGVNKMRRMRRIEICFLALFIIILIASIISGAVLSMSQVSLALLLIDFPIAVIIAFFASLSIREEEEEIEKF